MAGITNQNKTSLKIRDRKRCFNFKTIISIAILPFLLSSTAVFAQEAKVLTEPSITKSDQLQQIRNATLKITYAGTTFLIDPMLGKKGAYPGFEGTYRSELRNPLVELPMTVAEILDGVDVIVVTHTHLDHWDDAAQDLIPKNLPIFVQNKNDETTIESQGFTNVEVLSDSVEIKGVTLTKTTGQHGTDEMYAIEELAESLGEAMGIVLQSADHKTLYIVGDTIWYDEIDKVITSYNPDIIVLNAGYASLDNFEGSIIMGKEDLLRAVQISPNATIVATHLDAINHMAQTRNDLRVYAKENSIEDHIEIPEDGEIIEF